MRKCPGQDTRYWTPDDVSEVVCAACGHVLEFFKTEGSRKCPECGERVVNPAVSLGCAQWCAHAKECLGFEPDSVTAASESAEGGRESVEQRLTVAIREQFGQDQRRINHALAVLEQARQIMTTEGGEPRVVIAAALLHDIGIKAAERKHGSSAFHHQEAEGPPIARRILEDIGLDEQTSEHVCQIVGHHHSGWARETTEFRIIWDADALVNMAGKPEEARSDEAKRRLAASLKTDAGRKKAEEWFDLMSAAPEPGEEA